jgi:Cu-Zn family superoxide dismutase
MTGRGLELDVMLTGLAPGTHGMHIHEFGDCSAPDAASAGKHFNPHDALHGAPSEKAGRRHAGDLGNVTADASGSVRVVLQDSLLESAPDLKVVGRAVIVHAGEDDLVSQPGGASGEPVACGVIEAVAAGGPGSALR